MNNELFVEQDSYSGLWNIVELIGGAIEFDFPSVNAAVARIYELENVV